MPTLEKPETARPAIRHDPLPQAGDSLREMVKEQFFDKILPWFSIALFAILAAGLEWYRLVFGLSVTKGSAFLISAVAVVMLSIAAIKIRRANQKIEMLNQGRRGELHIAQYLEQTCQPLGYHVFHDIPCQGTNGPFNIDHALIGPGGVFSIETKTWTLPPASKGRATITVKDDNLHKSDGTFDNAAIPQAKNNADYLQKLLAQLTAEPPTRIPTRPVLLFPGWWINLATRPAKLWVLGNDTLHKFLPYEPCTLSDAEIALLTDTLKTHIRNASKS